MWFPLRAASIAMLGALALTGAARAQISENGPYYANPSWDQQIPTAQRFIVLINWGDAAVLDRETGLVWQQNPTANSEFTRFADALNFCPTFAIGGRYGWRMPAQEELSTLLDPTTNQLVAGAPFTIPAANTGTGEPFFWTPNTDPFNTNNVLSVSFGGAGPGRSVSRTNGQALPLWCVRGYQGTQSPQ